MNKRKILMLAMALMMAAILAVGGTLAYFTDTEQKHNTMVFGNVDIDIDELTYDNETGEWGDFEDDEFVLYPQKDEDGSLNYNKMVQTWNNSNNEEAAYIRTILLVEVPEGKAEKDFLKFLFTNNDNGLQHGAVLVGEVEGTDLVIDGVNYWAYAYTDKDYEPIPSGEYLSTMSSVWLIETATQEDVKAYGDKVDIIAFSQAIQSTDLSYDEAMEALGELTAANIIKWVTNAPEAEINNHYSFN